jgi:hypothetical protein
MAGSSKDLRQIDVLSRTQPKKKPLMRPVNSSCVLQRDKLWCIAKMARCVRKIYMECL